MKIWGLKNVGEHSHVTEDHPAHAITSLALSTDSELAASGSWNGEVVIWHVPSAEQKSPPLSTGYSPIRKTIFLHDVNQLLVISEEGASYCDLKSMTCGETIYLQGGWPLAVTSDGRRVVLSTFDGIEIYDLVNKEILYAVKTDIRTTGPAAITSEGKTVFIAEDNTLRIFDTHHRRFLPSINVDGGGVSSLEILPDGKQAVLGFYDGVIRLYNLEDHTYAPLLKKHGDNVRSLAVFPNGGFAVSCSSDATLTVWDLLKKEAIATFIGDSPLDSCVVTADGRTIIVGERSGRLHFLRLDEGEDVVLLN